MPNPLQLGILAGTAYVASGIQKLQYNEMGAIFFLEKRWSLKVEGGLALVLPGLMRMERFPRGQMRLTVTADIYSAPAEQARFYNVDGQERSFSDLTADEKEFVLADPLQRRIEAKVTAIILYEFVPEELFELIRKADAQDPKDDVKAKLAERARIAIEGELGHITLPTAFARKQEIGRSFARSFRNIITEASDLEDDERNIWGIRVVSGQIDSIKLPVATSQSLQKISEAFAERQAMIALANGEKTRQVLLGEGRGSYIKSVAGAMQGTEGMLAGVLLEGDKLFGKASVIITDNPLGMIPAMMAKFAEGLKPEPKK